MNPIRHFIKKDKQSKDRGNWIVIHRATGEQVGQPLSGKRDIRKRRNSLNKRTGEQHVMVNVATGQQYWR